MNTLGKATIGILVIAVGIFGGLYFLGGNNTPINTTLGASAGPDFFNDYFAFNENEYYPRIQTMRAATTTLCAFPTPSSTSTVEVASFIINAGTSTAATIDIATSTSAYGTTTLTSLVSGRAIASGAQGYGYFYPSGSVVNATVAPNQYVIVQTATAGLGGFTYGGNCKVVFKKL